jgi:predicted RNase H-like nuclease (RuvC/YqgF family)
MYSVEIKNNKEIYDFCMVNGITDINKFIQDCFKQGFDIKKYGLLGEQEKRVEIPVEVIKEVPIEKIVEKVVEVTKEIPVDRVVEVIKEVPVEKIVTIYDKTDDSELLLKIQQLNEEISIKDIEIDNIRKEFSTKTQEMENIFQNEMSKKDKELDEFRRNLDINLDENKVKMLETTLQNLRKELKLKNEKIKELEEKLSTITSNMNQTGAVYLKGSNIIENL